MNVLDYFSAEALHARSVDEARKRFETLYGTEDLRKDDVACKLSWTYGTVVRKERQP